MTARGVCTISGCGVAHHGKGFCLVHYRAFAKWGDPLFVSEPKSLEERFWANVDKNGPIPDYRPDLGPCWIWTARLNDGGYGRIAVGPAGASRTFRAHRLAYEWLVGPIPQGFEPDHLCRVRACVNPAHLEPVTRRENLRRGDTWTARFLAQTHCLRGHEFTPENTYVRRDRRWGGRQCKACQSDRQKRARRPAVAA